MLYPYNKKLVANAQALRRSMTREEKHLWYDFLKKLPITVNRQKNIGEYVVDFFIASKRIAIELDGRQHGMPEHKAADEKRDADLRELGIVVLRYANQDVNERFHAVCTDILGHIGLHPSDLQA